VRANLKRLMGKSGRRLQSLRLSVRIGDPAEGLTCLLCHQPASDDPDWTGAPGCEYTVRFLNFGGSAVAGVHKRCYDRAMQGKLRARRGAMKG
jgi:hypothetical protein